jgi:hypothetical protein
MLLINLKILLQAEIEQRRTTMKVMRRTNDQRMWFIAFLLLIVATDAATQQECWQLKSEPRLPGKCFLST